LNFMKTFRVPVGITIFAVIAAGLVGGPEVGLIVALLAVLEISISFDNAIVNAAVLKTMTEKWQRVFLTWGILIAVFGMRLVFPIVIVAAAAGLGIPEVLDLALNDKDSYAEKLDAAEPIIASFGGIFLLMVFLNFFLDDDKDQHWLGVLERPLTAFGRIPSISAAIACGVLLLLSQVVEAAKQVDVLVSGLTGLVTYLIANGIADRLEPDEVEVEETPEERAELAAMTPQARAAAASAVAKGGLASFMYLELLDASFSFDGVIGAFAISKDIVVIAIGLGLGAIYIRTLTVYLVRQGVLGEYRYLEPGAHWAIGVLAAVLFVNIQGHVNEIFTGLVGAGLIIAAFVSSVSANRRDEAKAAA